MYSDEGERVQVMMDWRVAFRYFFVDFFFPLALLAAADPVPRDVPLAVDAADGAFEPVFVPPRRLFFSSPGLRLM